MKRTQTVFQHKWMWTYWGCISYTLGKQNNVLKFTVWPCFRTHKKQPTKQTKELKKVTFKNWHIKVGDIKGCCAAAGGGSANTEQPSSSHESRICKQGENLSWSNRILHQSKAKPINITTQSEKHTPKNRWINHGLYLICRISVPLFCTTSAMDGHPA